MKHLVRTVLAGGALLCGCASPNLHTTGDTTGALTIRITSLLGLEGSYRDARISVDGRFAGNYEPDETVLQLPGGRHDIVVEIPSVYSRRSLPNGQIEIRSYALRGVERIDVLGRGSKQSLVFNSENLKSKEVEDHGH